LEFFRQVSQRKKIIGTAEFLNNIQQILSSTKSTLSDVSQLLNLNYTLEIYTWLCSKKVTYIQEIFGNLNDYLNKVNVFLKNLG